LKRSGIEIAAIVDSRDSATGPAAEEARALGIEVLAGHHVRDTSGRLRIRSMTVERLSGGSPRKIAVDALLTSAGWTPSLHLFSQSRGKVVWDGTQFVPGAYAQDCACVGSAAGTGALDQIVEEAAAAVTAAGDAVPEVRSSESRDSGIAGPPPGAMAPGKAFIDFQNDVTA